METCSICSLSRLPPEVYQSLHYLPDPVLSDSEEGHYKSFDEVYGEETTEKDRPSAKKAKEVGSRRFTVKNVKNANLMLQCEECELWRLVYSEIKLTQGQRSSLQEALADCVFTCGSPIEDLEVDNSVYTIVCTQTHLAATIWWKSSITVLGIPPSAFIAEMNVLVTLNLNTTLYVNNADNGKSSVKK